MRQASSRPSYARYFEAVRQSVVYENTTRQREYLCFVLQAAERCGKYEAVIVPLELGTVLLPFFVKLFHSEAFG